MKTLRRICSLILGTVFFLSGIFKLMDPVGSSLVVEEYLKFFHIGFLKDLSQMAAVFFALLESGVGAALITGVFRKIVSIASGVLIGFFTLLTLILLIFNPAMECGCFGEVLHLTHLQSFLKNIAFVGLWAVIFINGRNNPEPGMLKRVAFAVSIVSTLAFAVYFLFNIPAVDFADYKPGTELDTTPLSFSDRDGFYLDSLAMEGQVMVVSAYDPERLDGKERARISDFLNQADALEYRTLYLVSERALEDTYFADRKSLLTLNRSNGGVTFISDGCVMAKWSARNLPTYDELSEMMQKNPTETMLELCGRSRLRLQGFLLYVFAVMLLL